MKYKLRSQLTSLPTNKRARGAVVLSVVVLLLSLITLALWATSSLLATEYQANKSSNSYRKTMNQLQSDLTLITGKLRISDNWQKAAAENPLATVAASEYLGSEGQKLTLFEVSLFHPASSITVSQTFLRYPALVRIPAGNIITGANNPILSHLFDREANSLTPLYFPESIIDKDCDDLAVHPILWIRGHCNIPSSSVIGEPDRPLLLVVEGGNFTLNAHAQFYGLVVLLTNTNVEPTATIGLSAALTGAMVSNEEVSTILYGNIDFDPIVLHTLQQINALQKMQSVPGSWHDFN
ncbi:hypothetical protein Q4561_03950 [Alteromonas sp. 1_MG-2023]|uniref:hypothetical protein n=1 Tax=Alteromonas sp. 1_MG-2023 TaxID=3062669 RepID=UPI0026E13381|nr:hypothetical protein [Alteromonas sp. 1_MG-2023]MDO6566202.1 hypothetical protein [Alteromonas sp. 1_MG-2023]